MIGFNALGRMGRLANQMFQYASLKGIAKNVGADIIVPYYKDAIDDGIGNKLRSELFDSFNLNVNTGLLNNGNAPVVQERFFHFDEDLFKLCPDHVSLHGFFQSEKYFKHIVKLTNMGSLSHSKCHPLLKGRSQVVMTLHCGKQPSLLQSLVGLLVGVERGDLDGM